MLRSMFLGRSECGKGEAGHGTRERENKESELDGKGGNEREKERESGCYGDREGRGWLRGGCERRGESERRGKERLGKLLLSSPLGRLSLSLPVSFSLR